MSERKETPDLLGDILNTPAKSATAVTPSTVQSKAMASPKLKAKAKSQPSKRSTTKASVAVTKWEYREVLFREYRGWRPQVVNGEELDDWRSEPEILDYLRSVGADGWEMVGILENKRNTRSIFFKRALP